MNTNLDRHFTLQSSEVGSGQDLQHNYDLVMRDGAVRHQNILPITDLDNLIGIMFIQAPAVVAYGNLLRPRLTTPWVTEANNGLDTSFVNSTSETKLTLHRKRTPSTQGLTHMFIQAGKASDISDTSTRTEIINATKNDDNIYSEIMVPLYDSYASNTSGTVRDAFEHHSFQFSADINSACAIRTQKSHGLTSVDITAIYGESGITFDGTEFIAFYAGRTVGG